MDKPERLNQLYDRMMALLSASTRGAVISTDLANPRVESLDFMVKGFAAEMTAESLQSQLALIEQDLASLKGRLDSLSEMGETESLRLQMAMDRLTKLMTTLSNIVKNISD